MQKSVPRRYVWRALTGLAVVVLFLAGYSLWPWLRILPKKFDSLDKYRVYQPGELLDGHSESTQAGWRQPKSRFELLLALDHAFLHGRSELNLSRKHARYHRRPTPPPPRIPVHRDDELRDFVIERDDAFVHPTNWNELDEAIERGEAKRACMFFAWHQNHRKPFFGEVPLSLCYQETGPDRGNLDVNRFQIRKDFELVDVYLETPQQSQVLIVAGGSIYGAQEAVYKQAAPIAYPHEIYWAVVYAGSTHSTPTAYLVDRVTIGPKSSEILLHRPRPGAATADIHPYWFFVPLGRLPEGEYSVDVQLAGDDTPIASTKAVLRQATEKEIEMRAAELTAFSKGSERYYEKKRQREREHGATLQLQLERLAEFVHSAVVNPVDRDLLLRDVVALGEAVDWNQDIYRSGRHYKSSLAPPAPGETPPFQPHHNPWPENAPEWDVDRIPLNKIWMCDGTDAKWYASAAYRDIPELNNSLTVEKPSAMQGKIREIWNALAQKSSERHADFRAIPAAGKFVDAIDAAYEVYVDDKEPVKSFSADQEMWAVFVARRSHLIRRIDARSYQDDFRRTARTEFMIHVSAYLGKIDGLDADDSSPVTLAFIPLGRHTVDSVGVMFSLSSLCSRKLGSDATELLDAKAPETLFNDYRGYLCQPTGFLIAP